MSYRELQYAAVVETLARVAAFDGLAYRLGALVLGVAEVKGRFRIVLVGLDMRRAL